jgi:DNA-binding NtrC family response regulator
MNKRSILVIEDEPAVVQFVRAALERHGFDVTTAPDGDSALRLLQQEGFWAVISDMRTPGSVNGADVHAWLLSHRPELARRMLFITGDIANDETMSILRRTQVPVIEKPFRVKELMEKIHEVFGTAEDAVEPA